MYAEACVLLNNSLFAYVMLLAHTYLARKIVMLPPRYIQRKIKENNEDTVRFSRKFNGSQNKGYLYAASLV